jgi:hypothetical protein
MEIWVLTCIPLDAAAFGTNVACDEKFAIMRKIINII